MSEKKVTEQKEKYVVFHVQGGLGKNIAATALLKDLKSTYSDRKLICVVAYPEVFLNNPYADKVYFHGNTPYFYENYIENKDTLVFRHEPYHQTGHINKSKHLIENWCDLLGIKYTEQQPEIHVNMAQKMTTGLWLREKPILLLQTNGGPLTGQTYGYSWTRDMPYDVALEIANKHRDTHHIIQICRPDSQAIPGVEVASQPLSNMELFALVIASDKRVLIDSCLQHAAAAFNKPSTVIWVGTSPTVFGYKLHNNVVANVPPKTTKMINAYLFDYSFDGNLHECPYLDVKEMFDVNTIKKI
jgi:hypothetical protein